MAKKEIDFVIKVNNKELDLSKTSIQKYNAEIKKAKIDLKTLETQFGKNSIQYKGAAKDIGAVEKAWKTAQKAAGNMNDEIEKNEEQVKTYSQQIRIATRELVAIEKQFGKNSVEYQNQALKVKALREEQEDLQRSTLKLDDALSNLPGILGTVGQSLQQFDDITGSAKGALNTLGLGFKTLDQTIKTTLIGFIVGLFATLVAAVSEASKSFVPLKMAMAAIGDAVAALFDALKPLTDFILNVFVAAIKVATTVINTFASVLGGANAGLKKYSAELESNLKANEKILSDYGSFLSEHARRIVELDKTFNEKRKAAADDETLTQEQKVKRLKEIDNLYNAELKLILAQRSQLYYKSQLEIIKSAADTAILTIDNQRSYNKESLNNQRLFDIATIKMDKQLAIDRYNILNEQRKVLFRNRNEGTKLEREQRLLAIKALRQSQVDELLFIKDANIQKQLVQERYNATINRLNREQAREDMAIYKERELATREATNELIKNEFFRNLEVAKAAKLRLAETQRLENEANAIAGTTSKNLLKKQLAEQTLADEQIRKAQLQFDGFLIQLEVDKNNRLAIEAGRGTQEYFDARMKVIEEEYKKEQLLADGNQNDIENAASKHYQSLKELKQEQLQADMDLLSKMSEATYQNTKIFFDRQRDLLDKQYEIDQETYKNNEKMLLAIKNDYIKKREMVDIAALQWSSDYFMRRAETERKAYGQMYIDLKFAEDMAYEARKLAAKENAQELELIEREHNANMRRIREEQLRDYGYVASQTLDALANLTNAIAGLYDEEAKNSQEAFNKRKSLQLATAVMSTASGVIQILTQPSTLPSPFDWITKGINAAALLVSSYVQIDNIKKTQFQASSSSGTSGVPSGGTQYADGKFRGYAEGGMIGGERHAQGGTMIEAEAGEAIMTRGAVTLFGPLLSAINQMGGGTSFGSTMVSTYDKPKSETNGEQTTIIKTYVVETDLTSAQQKQARLKDLSTL
jgi:hypothetical protein